jgi:hypothetical protein
MIQLSKKFDALAAHLREHPKEPVPVKYMEQVLECLSEAAMVIRFYGRDANWFHVKQTEKFKFMAMPDRDATIRAVVFLEKYGWR